MPQLTTEPLDHPLGEGKTDSGSRVRCTVQALEHPMLNAFHRHGNTIRHFWGSELLQAPSDPGQDPRHVGTLEPLWNLFDLTREGRPTNWDEQLSY